MDYLLTLLCMCQRIIVQSRFSDGFLNCPINKIATDGGGGVVDGRHSGKTDPF